MHLRVTVVLFVLLAAGLGLFATLQLLDVKTGAERTERDKWLFPSLNLTDVPSREFTQVKVQRTNESGQSEALEFQRSGGEWKMTAPFARRANAPMVEELILQLAKMPRPPLSDAPDDPAQTGLDRPAAVVTFTLDAQRAKELDIPATYEAKIGNAHNPKSPVLFVLGSEGKTPIVVAASQLEKVFAPIAEFRTRDLLTLREHQLAGMRLRSGEQDLSFSRNVVAGRPGEPENALWRFITPPLGDADRTPLNEIVNKVTQLKVRNTKDFIHDGDLNLDRMTEFGLLKSGAASYEVTLRKKGEPGDAADETLRIGKRTPDSNQIIRNLPAIEAALTPPGWEQLGAFAAVTPVSEQYLTQVKVGAFYAQLPRDDSVFRLELDDGLVTLLAKRTDAFRDRRVAVFDRQLLDAITISQPGGEVLRFRRPDLRKGEAWDLYYKERPKVATHLSVVNHLITDLNRVEVNPLEAGKPSPFLDDAAKQKAWFGDAAIRLGLDDNDTRTIVELFLEGIKRDKDGKLLDGDGKPLLDGNEPVLDAARKPIRLTFGRYDEARGVVYVKREVEGENATILAVPEPWTAGLAAPQPGQPRPSAERVFLLNEVNQPYLAFRDHTLPSIGPPAAGTNLTGISKLTYLRNGALYEFDVEEFVNDKGVREERWVMTKPIEERGDGLRNRAYRFLQNTQQFISANQLLSDQANDEVFAQHDLTDKPFIKLAATLREKDKPPRTFNWIIGKPADPNGPYRNHFYARVFVDSPNESDTRANKFLFLLPWSTVKELDVELRNTEIFPFQGRNAPESLTLTWRKAGANKKLVETRLTITYAYAQPGDSRRTWTVQSLLIDGKERKGDLNDLDTTRLTHFLEKPYFDPERRFVHDDWPSVNPLTTPRFLTSNNPPPPPGLDPAGKDPPPQLVIEARYAGDGGVRTLIVGDRWEPKSDLDSPSLALVGPHAYYQATAATLPVSLFWIPDWLSAMAPLMPPGGYRVQGTFLIDEGRFKDLVESWRFFQREEQPGP